VKLGNLFLKYLVFTNILVYLVMENEVDYSVNGPSNNPFTGTFDVSIVRTYVVESATSDYGFEPQYFDVEQQSKTTLYKDTGLAILLCRDAKPATIKLFLYIAYELLKKDKDYIDLNAKQTQERLKLSKNTLYTAIGELELFKVLVRKKGRNQYWINTEYIFNGNRIAYLTQNAKESLKIVHQRSIVK